MRMGVSLVEHFFAAWQAILAKRTFSEEEMKAFNQKLKELEAFIQKHGNDKHPFAMGTENPTLIDIHAYACLARPYFTKDSVFNDEFWTKIAWDQCPRVMRLF